MMKIKVQVGWLCMAQVPALSAKEFFGGILSREFCGFIPKFLYDFFTISLDFLLKMM